MVSFTSRAGFASWALAPVFMSSDPNIILLYGNDEYAISRRLREFESTFPDASSADMNVTRLDARTMSANDLQNAVMSMPFLADHRLVLLANPSKRYVGPRTKTKVLVQQQARTTDQLPAQDEDQAETEIEALEPAPSDVSTEARTKFLELLGGMPPTTRLVISEVMQLRTTADQKAAENHWLVKWMRKSGLGLERHALPSPTEMTGWIVSQVKAAGWSDRAACG